MHRPAARLLLIGLAALLGASAAPTATSWADRDRDPVVLTGSDLPDLNGLRPPLIVAFRHDGADWIQIPVQVDERAVVDFGTIYHVAPTGYTILTYTDTTTFTGPDPDPLFDADDELVLMAKEAGAATTAAEPPGTIPGSGVELTIVDPLGGATAYAYLFAGDGTLDPGAGAHPVSYDFNLLSGNYLTTYNTQNGPNPEDSQVVTAAYAVHFADRWIRDETNVTAGTASGVDILDRHKNLFGPGICSRNEETFSNGEGAFIVNREGPVRALRAYVGANSGPTTHRIHTFYAEREDLRTVLRVHAIPGVMDFFDYSPAASGMIFRNDLNPDGVLIDGNPDQVTRGQFIWEMVSGDQGTLAMTLIMNVSIPGFDYTSYYSDDATPAVTQCTGDAYEYGASGFWENDAIPNTDPALGAYAVFEALRVMAYAPPNQELAWAETASAEALTPLVASGAPYQPSTAVAAEPVPPATPLLLAPNPLGGDGALRIDFTLPLAGPYTLALYDAAGRHVATLAAGIRPAGRHALTWDGSRLAPGVYFARGIRPGAESAAARLVRIK